MLNKVNVFTIKYVQIIMDTEKYHFIFLLNRPLWMTATKI